MYINDIIVTLFYMICLWQSIVFRRSVRVYYGEFCLFYWYLYTMHASCIYKHVMFLMRSTYNLGPCVLLGGGVIKCQVSGLVPGPSDKSLLSGCSYLFFPLLVRPFFSGLPPWQTRDGNAAKCFSWRWRSCTEERRPSATFRTLLTYFMF